MKIVLYLSLFFLFIPSTHSITFVSDKIDEDTSWQQAGSPYIVRTPITVDESASLLIERGTQVRFDRGCELIIKGTLIARGIPDEPIAFTSLSATPGRGDWGGIFFTGFSDNERCSLEHCIIEYAEIGVRCKDSSPTIKNCIIRENLQYGIRCEDASPAVIHNIISENGQAANGAGISLYGPNTSPIISYNVISHNQDTGIHARFQTKPESVKFNTIANNLLYGIYCTNQNLWESVTNCNIYGNKKYDCYNKQVADLNAQNNYWGADTTRELYASGSGANIKMFFDGNDREQWGKIIYDNWQTKYINIEREYKRVDLTSEKNDETPKQKPKKVDPKDSRGYIVYVLSDKSRVIIDYGKPDRVNKDLTFEVLRDGVSIGQVRVIKPGERTSEASVLNAKIPLRRGDAIALEPIVLLSGEAWFSSLRFSEGWNSQNLPLDQMRNWVPCKTLTTAEANPTKAMREFMQDSEAKVIWNIALAQRGKIYFRKNFDIEGKPSKATLKIAASNPCEIHLNGQLAGKLTDLKTINEFDVSLQVNSGGNIIAISTDRSTRNSVGLICELIVYRRPE